MGTRRKWWFSRGAGVVVGLCVLGCFVALGGESDATTRQSHIGELREQIADLQRRVEALEKQRIIPMTPDGTLRWKMPIIPGPGGMPDGQPQQVPDNWTPFQFNGMRYYLIPIEQDTEAAETHERSKTPETQR